MLKLRRATVLQAGPSDGPEQDLMIELAGSAALRSPMSAWLARREAGDDVIVNVQARDLGLGSGGFDIVHVNLTRGLAGEVRTARNVMKLNYTSLQHTVARSRMSRRAPPIVGYTPKGTTLERIPKGHTTGRQRARRLPLERPVAVLALHGQLAAVAWAFAQGKRPRLGSVTCRPRAGRYRRALAHRSRAARARTVGRPPHGGSRIRG